MTSGLMRVLLVAGGTLCVALGVVGMFLPLMPTTVFLLMAAYCYARSSDTFYQRLVNHRILGTYIKSARGGGMPRRAKVITIVLLWASIGATAVWSVQVWWLRLILAGIAAGVTVHVVRLPASRPVVSSEPDRAAL